MNSPRRPRDPALDKGAQDGALRPLTRLPPLDARRSTYPRPASAFSLLELLVVIGIMGMLYGLSGPILSTLKGAGDLAKASGDIQGILEQARSHAMANNTYVYVGLQEVDVIKAQSRTPSYTDGVGRVAVAAVSILDGTAPSWSSETNLTASGNISPISKLRYFDNLHITNAGILTQGANMTKRPGQSIVTDLSVRNSAITFGWPIPSGTTYSFRKVIEFDPQGVARVQSDASSRSTSIQPYIEIALLPARGNVAPTNANQAAIQINGITGAVNLYRP